MAEDSDGSEDRMRLMSVSDADLFSAMGAQPAASLDGNLHRALQPREPQGPPPAASSRQGRRQCLPDPANEWMQERFEDLSVDMFSADEAIAIYSTHQVQPPPGFEDVWFSRDERGTLSPKEFACLSEAAAVLIFSDVQDPQHVQSAVTLATSIACLDTNAPPVILLPHSAQKIAVPFGFAEEELPGPVFSPLNESIDVLILGEPRGVWLAGEVCGRILRLKAQASQLNSRLNGRRKALRHVACLEGEICEAVWEYLRVRLRTRLPPIDEDIGPGQPDTIHDFIIGAKLGEGSFGVVCRLVDPTSPSASSGQVLKIVKKKPLTSFYGIASVKRELCVMNLLSLDENCHRNVTRLHEVYHTETHLLFRIEDGGKMDLYKRLLMRDQRQPPLLIDAAKTTSIITQCCAGLCHLHMVPQVVHRDLKPENIIVNEDSDTVTIKLTDFDVALAGKPGYTMCSGKVGTFPFFAPEVILENEFDPFKADIWSLALVILEVTCRLNVLKKGLGLIMNKRLCKKVEEVLMMKKIKGFFTLAGNVNRLLRKFIQRDMDVFFDDSLRLLSGMLNIDLDDRWTATFIHERIQQLFSEPPTIEVSHEFDDQ